MNYELCIPKNHLSGRNSIGPRFQFRVRSIARKNLYLPLSMKALPEIRHLIDGVSPLKVFGCDSIADARNAFYSLRKKYDFPYWAALEHSVPDKDDPDKLVPLLLNPIQFRVIDRIFRKQLDGRPAYFLVAKSSPACGLTSCLQAYITWLRKYRLNAHAVTISSPSDRCMMQKDTAFVHFADAAKWGDRIGEVTGRIFSKAINMIPQKPYALFIMEGDKPRSKGFCPEDHLDMSVPEQLRLLRLSQYTRNPFFLDRLLAVSTRRSIIQYIDLDS